MGGADDVSNLSCLTAREHFIAHWLLARMYPENRKMLCAFNSFSWRVYGNFNIKEGNRFNSKNYDYAKRKIATYLANDSQWAEDCRERIIGTTWINNGEINRHVKGNKLLEYLEGGWNLGRLKFSRKPHSQKTRDLISAGNKNKPLSTERIDSMKKYQRENPKKWINNGQETISVLVSELSDYLTAGWCLGRVRSSKFRNKVKRTYVNKDGAKLHIPIEELDSFLELGWLHGTGEHIKHKQHPKHRTNRWINKDGTNKRVREEEIEEYVQIGWNKGRIYY